MNSTYPGIQMLFMGGSYVNTTVNGWSPITQAEMTGNVKAHYNFGINFHCN
jgi:hypothetical protein